MEPWSHGAVKALPKKLMNDGVVNHREESLFFGQELLQILASETGVDLPIHAVEIHCELVRRALWLCFSRRQWSDGKGHT